MISFKPKSWSVRLVDGFVLDDQVRADQCRGCQRTTELVVGNNSDPNSVLYGCNASKCAHTLIRLKVNFAEESSLLTIPSSKPDIQVSIPIQL